MTEFERMPSSCSGVDVAHTKVRLIVQLIQKAMNEAVTTIDVNCELISHSPANLSVVNDSPDGFQGISDILPVCETARISTTQGAVIFHPEKGRIEKPKWKRERGSVFQASIRLTQAEYDDVYSRLESLLIRENMIFRFNDEPVR